jgi:hypothetical protein
MVQGAFGIGERTREKFVVILQTFDDPSVTDVAVVVCSTDDDPGRALHSWELRVAARCFDRPTVVDGRWVFTVDQARFENAQPALATLDEDVMVELGCAIGVGLQLY